MFATRQAGVRHGRGRASARRSTSARRESRGSCTKSARRSQQAHELGHGHDALVLHPQQRLQDRRTSDYHTSADLTGQANHLGVTIQADIIKQKLPTNNGGYKAHEASARPDERVYTELTTDTRST